MCCFYRGLNVIKNIYAKTSCLFPIYFYHSADYRVQSISYCHYESSNISLASVCNQNNFQRNDNQKQQLLLNSIYDKKKLIVTTPKQINETICFPIKTDAEDYYAITILLSNSTEDHINNPIGRSTKIFGKSVFRKLNNPDNCGIFWWTSSDLFDWLW